MWKTVSEGKNPKDPFQFKKVVTLVETFRFPTHTIPTHTENVH